MLSKLLGVLLCAILLHQFHFPSWLSHEVFSYENSAKIENETLLQTRYSRVLLVRAVSYYREQTLSNAQGY